MKTRKINNDHTKVNFEFLKFFRIKMSTFIESEERNDIPLLRDLLNSNYPNERKDAVRRVVSRMRAGETVQDLFSDMLRCAKTDDIEL